MKEKYADQDCRGLQKEALCCSAFTFLEAAKVWGPKVDAPGARTRMSVSYGWPFSAAVPPDCLHVA